MVREILVQWETALEQIGSPGAIMGVRSSTVSSDNTDSKDADNKETTTKTISLEFKKCRLSMVGDS
jgi:hypothetical protein